MPRQRSGLLVMFRSWNDAFASQLIGKLEYPIGREKPLHSGTVALLDEAAKSRSLSILWSSVVRCGPGVLNGWPLHLIPRLIQRCQTGPTPT